MDIKELECCIKSNIRVNSVETIIYLLADGEEEPLTEMINTVSFKGQPEWQLSTKRMGGDFTEDNEAMCLAALNIFNRYVLTLPSMN